MAYGQDQYMAWLLAGLGLKHLKLGLEDFVTKQIDKSHHDLLQDVAMSMGLPVSDLDCSGQTLIQNVNIRTFRPTAVYDCQIHTTRDINICVSKKCSNATCNFLLKEIKKLHRLKKPIWCNTNINPSQWICDPWQFGKCFLSVPGNHHSNSIQEVDCAAILGIMLNLLPIVKSLKIDEKSIKEEIDILSKCRQTRNAIVHSHNYALDGHTMHIYLDTMKDVLKCIPASQFTNEAMSNIDQLKSGKLSMSEKEKSEIQAAAALAYRQFKLNGWMNEQEYFVPTRGSSETMKLLETSPCLVVTGFSGNGKSSIVHHAALDFQDQGYDIHMVDKPSQIVKNHQPEKKTVFVLDDPFGKGTIDLEKINKWNDNEDKLKHILQFEENPFKKKTSEEVTKIENRSVGKTIILISCRLNIYRNHYVSQLAKSLKFQECDLSSVDLCLTMSEKQDMFAKYINNITFESVKCDMDYFPLVCMLSLNKEPDVVKKIFKNPPKHIREEMENMKHDDTLQLQFCCLCLCVMFDQGFNLNWLRMWDVDDVPETSHKNKRLKMGDVDNVPDDDYSDSDWDTDDDYSDSDWDTDDMLGSYHKDHKMVINIIFKEFQCDVNSERIRTKLLDTFCTLKGTYCKEVGDIVVFRHDKILDIAAKICGETLLSTYISHANTKFIAKRYTLHDAGVTNEYLIHIPTCHEHKYLSRIFEDLTKKQTESFAFNDQLENENFQKKLMQYVETHNKQEIIQTTLHKDPETIERSLADIKGGFKTYSQFLFKLGVNKDNVLVWVCRSGNSEALEYLLTSCGVNVNTQRKYGYDWYHTPLTAAVRHGNVHNVSLLLQFKADVNLGDYHNGMSPLMWASYNKNKPMLELLLENNASVTQCDGYGRTALHWRCEYGADIEIVKLLLEYKSDVTQCDDIGKTALHHCFGRYPADIENVKLLLLYKSDVTQCDKSGETALHYCCGRYPADIEIVKLLLLYKSDVTQCDDEGKTALHYCCGRYPADIEIVKLLLLYKSDVTHRDKWGKTPVGIAKEKGRTNIVHILQQHGKLHKDNDIVTVEELRNYWA